MTLHTVRLGTRGSALARWQTDYIAARLQEAWPNLTPEIVVLTTRGDQVLDTPLPLIGGKGLFTAELEEALRAERIDIAVHSLKDLPTDMPDGLPLGAVPVRAPAADVLISRDGHTVDTLPQGARVGTSSRRRGAQLLRARPDLALLDLRGNVDTRVRKALDPLGSYDAIVLAQAGLTRLGVLENPQANAREIPFSVMLPAPGQGALGVQTRDDDALLALLAPLHHPETAYAVTAERAFLGALGGGCSVPVAAYGTWDAGIMKVRGRVSSVDGSQQIDVYLESPVPDQHAAQALGQKLAAEALALGADSLLELEK